MRRIAVFTVVLGLIGGTGAIAVASSGSNSVSAKATKSVKVNDNSFSPSSLSVKKGTTVKWKWKGSNPHNVTVTSGPTSFSSSTRSSGTFSKKLKKKGTYKIICTIHSGMGMKIKVK